MEFVTHKGGDVKVDEYAIDFPLFEISGSKYLYNRKKSHMV